MSRIFREFGGVLVAVVSVVALIGLVVFLMADTGVMSGAFGSVTGMFVDKSEQLITDVGSVEQAEGPLLTILAPESSSSSAPTRSDTTTYLVYGKVFDKGNGVSAVLVNDVEVSIGDDGSWSAEITMSETGVTAVQVVATDNEGKATIATRYVTCMPAPVLAAGNTWFDNEYGIVRANVTSITVVNTFSPVGTSGEDYYVWDASAGENGSVVVYATDDDSGKNTYALTIVSNGSGKIILSPDSSGLFSGMSSLRSISGLGHVDSQYVENLEGAFSGDAALTNIDLSSWQMNNVNNTDSLFEACANLEEVKLGTGLTSLGNRMFFACDDVRKITGCNSVTSIGDYACYLTLKISKIDLVPEHISNIGISALRLSSVEDCVDFSNVQASVLGKYATRLARWDANELSVIQNLNGTIESIFIDVPNPDSQGNYSHVPFGRDSNGVEYSVAGSGCFALAYYHVWNALHTGTEQEYGSWIEWWNATLNSDGTFADYNIVPTNNETVNRVSSLGWVQNGVEYVNGAEQLAVILDRLSNGIPVICGFNNSTYGNDSTAVTGYHAAVIIGYDSATGKLAIIDSNVPGHPSGCLYWVSFEDFFVGGNDRDRIFLYDFNL